MRVSERALEAVVKTDWSNAKIKAWGRGIGNVHVLDIEKETKTFICVIFEGAFFKLRKSNFFGSWGESDHVFLRRTEFGLLPNYVALPPPNEECDKCGINLPCDVGFGIEATCLENNNSEDDFNAHLCHECFGQMEEDWFKK